MLCAICSLARPLAAQPIEITDLIDGSEITGPVSLSLSANQTGISKSMYLSRTGAEDFVLSFEPRSNSPGLNITFSPESVVLPAQGSRKPVTMKVTYQGTEDASAVVLYSLEDDYAELLRVQVQRAAPQRIQVLDIDPTEGLQLRSSVTPFTHALQIRSSVTEETDIVLSASLFEDPTGAQVQPTLTANGMTSSPLSITVPGRGYVTAIFGLEVPLPGDYEGALILEVIEGNNTPTRTLIDTKVTRSRVAPSVVFDDVEQLRTRTSDTPIRTKFSLRETADVPVSVDMIHASIVEVEDSTEIDVPLSASFRTAEGANQNFPINLNGGERRPLILEVLDLNRPGHYRAKLSLNSADSTPVTASIDLLVRRPIWLAMVLIAVSVVLSEVLRVYYKNRFRLIYRVRISEAADLLKQLRERLRAKPRLDEREEATFNTLRVQLDYWYEKTWRSVDEAELTEFLTLFAGKLRWIVGYWVELRHLKPTKVDHIRKLEEIRQFIERSKAASNNELKNARSALEQIEREINEERRTWNVSAAPLDRPGITGAIPTYKNVRNRLLVFELITTSVLLAIAVMLGTYLIYLTDYTWGSWSDFFVAVLWGFGLHTVGGTTFQGLDGLRTHFEKLGAD
jgi:hypothetical protein